MKKQFLIGVLLASVIAFAQTKIDINNQTKSNLSPSRVASRAFANLSSTCNGTQNWNISSNLFDNKFITTTGACTLTLSNLINGGSYVLKVIQGSGGSLVLGSGCAWKVSSGGSGAVTQSSTTNNIDILAFTYDGTNCLANYNKNFN